MTYKELKIEEVQHVQAKNPHHMYTGNLNPDRQAATLKAKDAPDQGTPSAKQEGEQGSSQHYCHTEEGSHHFGAIEHILEYIKYPHSPEELARVLQETLNRGYQIESTKYTEYLQSELEKRGAVFVGLTGRITPQEQPGEQEETVSADFLYKDWLKATKRSGSVLLGSSVRDFISYLDSHFTITKQ